MSDLEKLPPLLAPLVMVNRYGLGASTSDGDGGVFTADQMRAYARAALAQQPAASGEPVAEVHPSHLRSAENGNEHWCREVLLYSGNSPHDHGLDGNYRIKLYAAAQPSPARVPLPARLVLFTLRDLKAERRRLDGFIALGNELSRAAEYDEWIVALEAYCDAHGILPQQLKDEK